MAGTLAETAIPKSPQASDALRLLMRTDPQTDLENYERCIEAFVVLAVDEVWERRKIEAFLPRNYEIRWNAPEAN